jgi:hypothetical protein
MDLVGYVRGNNISALELKIKDKFVRPKEKVFL